MEISKFISPFSAKKTLFLIGKVIYTVSNIGGGKVEHLEAKWNMF